MATAPSIDAARRARLVSSLGTLIDALTWFASVATGARDRLALVPPHEPIAPADLDDAQYVADALLRLPEGAQEAAGEVLGAVRDLRSLRLVSIAGGRS